MFPEGRLFDFLIVGVVALIVVGPKDLPILMRKVGQFMAKMRGMAAEFRTSFDDMARHAELDELRKEVDALRIGATSGLGLGGLGLGAGAGVREVFEDINLGMRAGQSPKRPPSGQQHPGPTSPVDVSMPVTSRPPELAAAIETAP
jgi:sec-independent protein translocase protein TatB